MSNQEQAIINIKVFKLLTGVSISLSMSGKMQNVWGISTLCSKNSHCLARREIEGSICKEGCFAFRGTAYKANCRKSYGNNYDILTTCEIPVGQWPDLCGREIFRIESYGDVENVLQCKNYINFARRNPRTVFAAWTKNLWIWSFAFKAYGKPKNMRLIYSSIMINTIADCQSDYVDAIFTVWDSEKTANAAGKKINCGARSCDSCRNCYRFDGDYYVNEIFKK